MKPKRVQRKRTAGWRMPANTVYVGRGSKWGNPLVIGQREWGKVGTRVTRENAVELFREYITCDDGVAYVVYPREAQRQRRHILDRIHELKGKNLACWGALDKPCHADVLLEIANS